MLDIRGQRADAAEELLRKFLDDAILAGLRSLHIIHGKGNGILRTLTARVLKSIPAVEHFGEAPLTQGGSGATEVQLR